MTTQADRGVRRARTACGALALLGAAALLALPRPWGVEGGPGFFASGRPLAATVPIALWWATALNMSLCLLLAATAGRWAASAEPTLPARHSRARGFALLLLAASLLALGLRWPLAGTSLWPDEAWTVQNTVAGITRPARRDPTRMRVRVVTWQDAFFAYERPTNHVLYIVAALASNELWRRAAGREPPAFSERAARLPALLAALLAVPLLGLLLRDWGFPRAGIAAAFLLATHPWHIAAGAEARGYSFVLLFALAACLALGRALALGAWRWWLLYAAALVGLVWSHLFAVFLAAALGAAGLIAAHAGGASAHGGRRAWVAHVLAGMLLLQVMAPNLAQMAGWREHFVGRSATQLSPAALGHLWSFASLGIEARLSGDPPERPDGVYPSLAGRAVGRPWLYPVVVGVLPLLALLGGLRVVARGGPARAVALGLAGSLPLALLVTQLQGGQWYPRFAFWTLLYAVGFGAIGLESILERLPWPGPRARRMGVAAGLAAGVGAYQALVAPQTALLLTRPQLASREALSLARERGGPDTLVAVLGLRGGNMHFVLYDPQLREIEDAAELATLLEQAQAEGRPLYVLYAYAYKNRDVRPDAFRMLDDPALFQEEALLHAVFDERMVRVLRWTGRAPAGGAG
jgi:hypothetical protein